MPLVSRILPSDICRIHKKGSKIRVDTTLVDFTDMHWERGDISIVFNGDAERQQSLFILDNKQKVYQQIRYQVILLNNSSYINIIHLISLICCGSRNPKVR